MTLYTRRPLNARLFVASLAGTVLLVAGIGDYVNGGGRWWVYLAGFVACVVLAFAPGKRIRDRISPPDA